MNKILPLLALAMVLSSCATINKIVTKPVYTPIEEDLLLTSLGLTYDEIVQRHGEPKRVVSDGMDGRMVVYETVTTELSSYASNGIVNGTMNTETTALSYRSFKEFYLGADGLCYDVKSNISEETGRAFSPLGALALTGGTLAASLAVFGLIAAFLP